MDPSNLLHRTYHDDVIKWKHFPRYWPVVTVIHRSLVNSPHKGQWRGALKFSLIYVRMNGWVNNREAGDLRRHHAHYYVIVMICRTMAFSYKCVFSHLILFDTYQQFCHSQWFTVCKPVSRSEHHCSMTDVSLYVQRDFDTRKTWTWTCRKGPASVTSSEYVHAVALFTRG